MNRCKDKSQLTDRIECNCEFSVGSSSRKLFPVGTVLRCKSKFEISKPDTNLSIKIGDTAVIARYVHHMNNHVNCGPVIETGKFQLHLPCNVFFESWESTGEIRNPEIYEANGLNVLDGEYDSKFLEEVDLALGYKS